MEQFIPTGPFKPIISLKYLAKVLTTFLSSENEIEKIQAEQALKVLEKAPELVSGVRSYEVFASYKKEIEQVMSILFPAMLTKNEIKAAVFPFSNQFFYASERFLHISKQTTTNIEEVFRKLYKKNENVANLNPYAIILNQYYGYKVDFERPKLLTLDGIDGKPRTYRVTFNADFIEMYPNENAIEITPEILDILLTNADDEDVWQNYFPDNSWTIEGFGILSMIDVTLDQQIDTFKTHLIQPNKESFQFLLEDIREIFNLPNLRLGSYKVDHKKIIAPHDKNFEMLTLAPGENIDTSNYACDHVNNLLFNECKPAIISNVENYHKKHNGNRLSNALLDRGLKSAALLPISIGGELGFIIELATSEINQINAINMVKLESIIPFILSYTRRTVNEFQNEVSAVIQQECTSIHPSVEWRFEEEATKYIYMRNAGYSPKFEEITFKDVFPLYGQVDIVGSSLARNEAIQQDITEQLEQSKMLLTGILAENKLPFYEQLIFQIDKNLAAIKEDFHANSEQEINAFFKTQLYPLFRHIEESTAKNDDVSEFLKLLDKDNKTLYKARKEYDTAVDQINTVFSAFMDKKQHEAQEMFPHYFEKYKTDGLEHNMYVGQSIVKRLKFHDTVLYNLRLWQLQVTCEMEAMYYQQQKKFPLPLKVASLILAYDIPITIRYRIDEKQFDVDGAYNVRYEMIKKRIDKAHIKDTNERLTQPHKLCVVFSSSAIEREYLAYFEFLQSKNYIGKNIEVVELEELQGASGIKAIRVDINQNLQKSTSNFTVEDLQTV
ncbi:hypothetical protein [Joostella sp. CR20]|uniref:hypothetical protein n=1 Tax=Joostella sp. CR20 TaxID=2804312 RepID=UPI00313D07D8